MDQSVLGNIATIVVLLGFMLHMQRSLHRDITGLNEKIGQLEVRLNEKMGQLEVRLNEKMDMLEVRLNEKISQLELRLTERIATLEVLCGGSRYSANEPREGEPSLDDSSGND